MQLAGGALVLTRTGRLETEMLGAASSTGTQAQGAVQWAFLASSPTMMLARGTLLIFEQRSVGGTSRARRGAPMVTTTKQGYGKGVLNAPAPPTTRAAHEAAMKTRDLAAMDAMAMTRVLTTTPVAGDRTRKTS